MDVHPLELPHGQPESGKPESQNRMLVALEANKGQPIARLSTEHPMHSMPKNRMVMLASATTPLYVLTIQRSPTLRWPRAFIQGNSSQLFVRLARHLTAISSHGSAPNRKENLPTFCQSSKTSEPGALFTGNSKVSNHSTL